MHSQGFGRSGRHPSDSQISVLQFLGSFSCFKSHISLRLRSFTNDTWSMARRSAFPHVAHSKLNNRLHHLLNRLRSPMATPTGCVRPEPKLTSPGNVLNRQTWRARAQRYIYIYIDRSDPTQRKTAQTRRSGRPLTLQHSGRPLHFVTAGDRPNSLRFTIAHPTRRHATRPKRSLTQPRHSRPIQTTRVAIHRKTIKQDTSFVSR